MDDLLILSCWQTDCIHAKMNRLEAEVNLDVKKKSYGWYIFLLIGANKSKYSFNIMYPVPQIFPCKWKYNFQYFFSLDGSPIHKKVTGYIQVLANKDSDSHKIP